MSDTKTLIDFLFDLSDTIEGADGNNGFLISKAADTLEQLERKLADQELTIATMRDVVTNDKMSNKGKVLAIQFLLRKEAQP